MTSYYSRTAFTRNTLAKAEDVNTQLAAIQSGFEKLPTPHASAPTTKGFNEVFKIVDATSRDHPISAGQIQDQGVSYIAAGGTANALTATLAPAISAYAAGMRVCVLAASTNTGAVTINVNSKGTRAITKSGATALTGGEITAGMMLDLLDDGTQFQLTGLFSTSTVTMLDEDDMASDSATNTASQQSIKYYIDNDVKTVAQGGTGVPTFALNGVLFGNTASAVGATAIGAEGQILRAGASPFVPAWTTATFPATTTVNQILYSSAANAVAGITTAASGVLVTSAGGVPSIATDIPTAVTIGGKYSYRAEGTDVPVADGGTGASTLTDGSILVGAGTSAIEAVAVGLETEILVGGGAGTNPVWTTATGTGAPVRATSPTLVTPLLGTPISGILTGCNGFPGKNMLINGCHRHAQRGASGTASFDDTTNTPNSDDTWIFDRKLLLSDGDNIVDITQQTLGGVNSQEHYVRLDVETTGKKFMWGEIIENKNCKHVIGDVVSASVELRVTNAAKLSDVRVVVLSWDGGIDVLTSDWISAWEAQGTVPTPIGSWVAENVAADLNVTTSWVKYEIENISIDAAGADNVAMFVYSNAVGDNDTAGIFLEIANMQLEKGAVATDFEYRDVGQELQLCQPYYCKSYNSETAPATATDVGVVYIQVTAAANADYSMKINGTFPVRMRVTPTVVGYDAAGIINQCTMQAGSVAIVIDNHGSGAFQAGGTNGASTTVRQVRFQYTADAEL